MALSAWDPGFPGEVDHVREWLSVKVEIKGVRQERWGKRFYYLIILPFKIRVPKNKGRKSSLKK